MLTCREIDSLLESFVDGDLTLNLSQDVRDHVAACPDCQVKVVVAKQIVAELHSMPQHTCPDTVVQKVLAQIQPKRKIPFGRARTSFSQLRPRHAFGLSIGLAVVCAVLISLSIYHPGFLLKNQHPHYTTEEIAQAKKDIYMALGYVNYATSRTQQIIEKEVVPQNVIRPIQKSLDAIHTYKEKGDAS